MKIVPIITAVFVTAALYLLIFERDRLFEFAQELAPSAQETTEADTTEMAETEMDASEEEVSEVVRVVALASEAQTIENAVVVRGRTEAARQVMVAAETAGLVISEPLRKGAQITVGDTMCQLDPGTRLVSLAEAEARLVEAQGRIPEAEAAVATSSALL